MENFKKIMSIMLAAVVMLAAGAQAMETEVIDLSSPEMRANFYATMYLVK